MKNSGHNLSAASLTDMHRFPPTGHDQDKAQGTTMLHRERSNLSHPPPHVPNDQDARNKSNQTPTNNTEHRTDRINLVNALGSIEQQW